MAPADTLQVELVFCPSPGVCDTVTLHLAPGATLDEALAASGLLQRHGLARDTVKAGVWSRVRPLDAVLRDGDRVEIYRPLQVDPKEARRQRYKRHRQGPLQDAAVVPAPEVPPAA